MIHLIANPYAQSGVIRPVIDRLTARLDEHNMSYVLHLTEYAGHASEIASRLTLCPSDRLILLGGDGSLDELINGLALPCPCPFHLLPSGTGNDFARGVKLDRSLDSLMNSLQSDSPQYHVLDLGHVEYATDSGAAAPKRFAVSCGIGMDAAVCVSLQDSPIKEWCNRLHLGKLAYVIHGVAVLLQTSSKKRTSATLVLDHKKSITYHDTAFISCHNTPYEGGGFPFAPEASPSDGLLSVCIVTVPNRLLLIPILLASLMGGNHTAFKSYVHIFNCRDLTIHSAKALPIHTDGEIDCDVRSLHVSVIPQVLPLVRE